MNGPRNSAFSRVTLLFLMSKAQNIKIAVMAILSRLDTPLLTNYLIIFSALNALNLKNSVMRVAHARDTWHGKGGYESGYGKNSYFLRALIITFILEWFSLDCQNKFALVFRCHVKPRTTFSTNRKVKLKGSWLVWQVFPRYFTAACICFDFWLVNSLCSLWLAKEITLF